MVLTRYFVVLSGLVLVASLMACTLSARASHRRMSKVDCQLVGVLGVGCSLSCSKASRFVKPLCVDHSVNIFLYVAPPQMLIGGFMSKCCQTHSNNVVRAEDLLDDPCDGRLCFFEGVAHLSMRSTQNIMGTRGTPE